nr:DUF429 domain-containing protein [Acidithiobacillus caldus]
MAAPVTVLSVDLAYKRYRDCGIALLRRGDGEIRVEFPNLGLSGSPRPDALAQRLAEIAAELGASCMLLDGPQAWKDGDNGCAHSRCSERALNTPAKTGTPGQVKPANYGPFVAFSIAVFDTLAQLGWPRLEDPHQSQGRAVESFPTAAWRGLGLRTLPAKAKTHPIDLDAAFSSLCARFPLQVARKPNHDELQALVAGLAGLALEVQEEAGYWAAGVAPFWKAGMVREGFIVVPRPSGVLGHAARPYP